MITGIISTNVSRAWPMLEELIEEALEQRHANEDLRSIYINLLTTKMQLWLVGTPESYGVIITETVQDPVNYVCRWVLVATRRLSFQALYDEAMPTISAWAESLGCNVIRANVRPGMEKRYKNLSGWKTISVEVEYELCPRAAEAAAPLPATNPGNLSNLTS